MPVRTKIPVYDGVFFVTLTCCDWLNLFELADSHDAVYRWFDFLKIKGHHIVGYVIMPNHLHCLLAFRNTNGQLINKIVGNGKRFMAYHIVDKLKKSKRDDILQSLSEKVSVGGRAGNKRHEVFEPSFDWKECYSEKFFEQKLSYIHQNPCKGKWNLVEEYWMYTHSSAKYYVTGIQGIYPVTHFNELQDIDLTVASRE